MKRGDPLPGRMRDLGEFGFIDHVRHRFGGPVRRGEIGIGDDGAVLRSPRGDVVLSTDLLVEGTHFDFRYFLPEELGWRALMVNLSDLAAMGAVPVCYLVAVAAPPSTPVAVLTGIFRGMARAGRQSGIRLVGGDTCRGEKVLLSVTVMGKVSRGKAVPRGGARPGDLLFVTGEPGWSRLGLSLLSGKRPVDPTGWRREAMRRHLTPVARLSEGIAAARTGSVSAMIDLSDGLLPDLSHFLEAGRMGAVLDEKSFRLSARFREAAAALGIDPVDAYLAGGEDYELLMAVRPHRYEAFRKAARLFPSGAAPIGVVTGEPGIRVRRADGRWIREGSLPRGFSHYSPSGPSGASKGRPSVRHRKGRPRA